MRNEVGLTNLVNTLAVHRDNGTCVEVLNTHVFDKVKYVNFIKPGSCETTKLTMKEFHHLYRYVNRDFLGKVILPSYNIAVQKELVSVDTDIEQPSFEVNHNACN